MRVLFVCLPGTGHVRPLLPLARAAAAAGHQVTFATGADFAPMVRAAGFGCARVGPTRDQARAERLRRHPDSGYIDPVEQQRFHVRMVWASIYAPWMLADLTALVHEARPDLIVHDAMAFAVPLLAARTGIPTVSHSTGPAFAYRLLEEAAEQLTPLWRETGATPPRATGMYETLHIDVWPGSLQPDDIGDRGAVHLIAGGDDVPEGAEPEPDWFAELPELPIVHLTLGTVFNHNPKVFRAVLEGLSAEPVTVLASVGRDQDPDSLGPVPPNARVERWLPHGPLLRRCALVACHGGAGTTLKTLRLGRPLLLLPQGADMFRTARSAVERGIARSLMPDAVEPDAVRTAVRALLAEPSHRRAAAGLSAELAAMPSPAEVVPVLENLVPTPNAARRSPSQ